MGFRRSVIGRVEEQVFSSLRSLFRALNDFHTASATATDEVMSLATSGGESPYLWLARAVSDEAGRILDVGCVSTQVAEALQRPGRLVDQVDVDRDERLAWTDDTFDVVVASTGLASHESSTHLLAEVSRVLKPDGMLAALFPIVWGLTRQDAAWIGKMSVILRKPPQLSKFRRHAVSRLLPEAGFDVVEDGRELYRFPIHTRAEAELFLTSAGLLADDVKRLDSGVDWLLSQAEKDESFSVPLMIRRVLAVPSLSTTPSGP